MVKINQNYFLPVDICGNLCFSVDHCGQPSNCRIDILLSNRKHRFSMMFPSVRWANKEKKYRYHFSRTVIYLKKILGGQ